MKIGEQKVFQMKKNNYSYVGISFIILLFGIYAVPKIVKHFQTADLHKFTKVPNFEFINQDGKTITNQDYNDKVYVVEFFFATCPTICPIMNAEMVTIQNEFMGNPKFGIASFSITPEISPLHPACASPTIVPSLLLIKTGKQSAVIIAQTTPTLEVKLASASTIESIFAASIHFDE